MEMANVSSYVCLYSRRGIDGSRIARYLATRRNHSARAPKGGRQAMTGSESESDLARATLQKILASDALQKSETSQRLLRYLVERALRGETPKEVEIAIDAFGRDASFNSGEESLVRVAVRGLRRRLDDYYNGAGQGDEWRFELPKGGYRLIWAKRDSTPAEEPQADLKPEPEVPSGISPRSIASRLSGSLRAWPIIATLLLGLSLGLNVYQWQTTPRFALDPKIAPLAQSSFWSGIIDSDRPLMMVLGDGFMYTNVDPTTGRVQYIRDRAINSSEELRVFLAQNPSIAQGRGQRYTSMLQKSTALGMTSVLQLVSHPGRTVEVRLPDDVQADDIRRYDIVYVGPISRLGPLAGYYETQSRYRYDAALSAIRDTETNQSFLPDGPFTEKHTEYALAARFVGPSNNHIVILTPGTRNSGMGQIIRMFTAPEWLAELQKKLNEQGQKSSSFEALLSVTSFRLTDVSGELLAVHRLPHRR